MEAKTYHICTESLPRTIFRVDEDFRIGENKLGIAAEVTDSSIIGYCLMANHSHSLVKTKNIKEFINQFRIGYTSAFNNRNKTTGALFGKINSYPIENEYHQRTVLNYILKNPVHHMITETAFQYPYSSINYYFQNELTPPNIIKTLSQSKIYKTPSNLDTATYRKIFSKNKVSDKLIVDPQGHIPPSSYLNIEEARFYYNNNVNNFLLNINKALKEDYDILNQYFKSMMASEENVNPQKNYYGLRRIPFNRIQDITICEFIANNYPDRTFKEFTPEELNKLQNFLQNKFGISTAQFNRCMWI